MMGMRGWMLPVATGSILLLGTACSGGKSGDSTAQAHAAAADSTPAAVTITPANTTAKVRPDNPVTVAASSGKLQQVTLKTGTADPVAGQITPDGKSWQNSWNLKPGATYTVTAVAKNGAGKITTQTSSFTTMKASSTFHISDVTPGGGETVGIGMPIMLTFDNPISDRAAVEKSLELKMSTPVEGAWHWMDNEHVTFLARNYFAPHSTVTLIAHLTGTRAAAGMYGTSDVAKVFKIGASHVTTVNVKSHHLNVVVDGTIARKNVPISAGRATAYDLTTTSGIHIVMGKSPLVTMTSAWEGITDPKQPGYYSEPIADAVQLDASGEYIHSMPSTVWAQGHENVSHGCVNSPPWFASWYFGISRRGDVVKIVGTDRQLEADNGYGYYQMSWTKWVAGSALKTAINQGATAPVTSPSPSTPVPSPSTSPSTH
jgi:lipoprotein-anchoring transpeptidase ErfK/SrfK